MDESRHPADVPPRVVREYLGADGQPLCFGKRAALGLEHGCLADGVDSLRENDGHRSRLVALIHRRAASATVRKGLALVPEFVSAPLAGFK